jgi:hypothetical protein
LQLRELSSQDARGPGRLSMQQLSLKQVLRDIFGFAVVVMVLCALFGGVTVGGVHHGIGCSCERGVVIQ